MSTNMYIRFEEPAVQGTSTAPAHEKEIEVLSWSHGFTQPTSPTRSTAGTGTVERPNHANLTFSKYLDQSSSELLKLCWSGKQFGKVTIRCYRADGSGDHNPVEYLKVTMQHVVISNLSIAGGAGDVPVENVSLDYGVIEYTYTDQKHGDSSAKHDLHTGAIS